MSLVSEMQEIMDKVDKAVNLCLATDISKIADECIQFRVKSNVYDQYQPSEYERREKKGGIADPRMYSHNIDPITHTLTVIDERHEVGVVESGTGYTWEKSRIFKMQPFPRPYFADAQEDVYTDGEAHAAIVRAMEKI